MNTLIFILDKETFGVYQVLPTVSVANLLATGILDSFVRVITRTPEWEAEQPFSHEDIEMIIQNRLDKNVQLSFDKNLKKFNLSLLPAELTNEKFLQFKHLAYMRGYRLRDLERMFAEQMGRVDSYLTEIISPIIRAEVAKMEGDNYSPIIREYATINSISPRAAYQELKLRSDSNDLIYMRNYAFFVKYSRAFNLIMSNEEGELLWKECINDLFLKATV